jgi:hypothetical protein
MRKGEQPAGLLSLFLRFRASRGSVRSAVPVKFILAAGGPVLENRTRRDCLVLRIPSTLGFGVVLRP